MTKRKLSNVPVGEDDWRARSDMSTLASAEEIKADKRRLSAAQAAAKQEVTKLAKVVNHAPTKPRRGQKHGGLGKMRI